MICGLLDKKKIPITTYFALKDTEQEKERIFRVLEQTNRNKNAVVRLFGIGRTTLYWKMLENEKM